MEEGGWPGGTDEGICPKERKPGLPQGELQGWAGWPEVPLRTAPFEPQPHSWNWLSKSLYKRKYAPSPCHAPATPSQADRKSSHTKREPEGSGSLTRRLGTLRITRGEAQSPRVTETASRRWAIPLRERDRSPWRTPGLEREQHSF